MPTQENLLQLAGAATHVVAELQRVAGAPEDQTGAALLQSALVRSPCPRSGRFQCDALFLFIGDVLTSNEVNKVKEIHEVSKVNLINKVNKTSFLLFEDGVYS